MSDDKTISVDVVKQMMAEQSRQNAEMLKSVIEELKKPTILEQKALDAEIQRIKDANEERKGNAAGILSKIREESFARETCTHEHGNGVTHGVYVAEAPPSRGYIYCQVCYANVRPDPKPEQNADPRGIYDVNLFNRMWQKLPSNELFM